MPDLTQGPAVVERFCFLMLEEAIKRLRTSNRNFTRTEAKMNERSLNESLASPKALFIKPNTRIYRSFVKEAIDIGERDTS